MSTAHLDTAHEPDALLVGFTRALAAELAGALALFRDEPGLLKANRAAILVAPAAAILLLAHVVDAQAAVGHLHSQEPPLSS